MELFSVLVTRPCSSSKPARCARMSEPSRCSMRLGHVPVSKIGVCECLFPRGAVASFHKPSVDRFADLVLTADTTHMIRAVFVSVRIGPATPARFLQRLFSGHNNLLSHRHAYATGVIP